MDIVNNHIMLELEITMGIIVNLIVERYGCLRRFIVQTLHLINNALELY